MSQLLGREVWWCKDEPEAETLVAQGISRGEIYTEWERRLLWELRANRPLVLKAAEAKQMFDGTVEDDMGAWSEEAKKEQSERKKKWWAEKKSKKEQEKTNDLTDSTDAGSAS